MWEKSNQQKLSLSKLRYWTYWAKTLYQFLNIFKEKKESMSKEPKKSIRTKSQQMESVTRDKII
jgi:hypothetical protein